MNFKIILRREAAYRHPTSRTIADDVIDFRGQNLVDLFFRFNINLCLVMMVADTGGKSAAQKS